MDIYVFFGKQCLTCPFLGPDRCTTSQTGRKLSLNTFHDLIQPRRQEERTEPFQLEMHARAAIEGTISELIRAHGLRRARYRGARKVALQALFTTAAANLKRLAQATADSLDIRNFGNPYLAVILHTGSPSFQQSLFQPHHTASHYPSQLDPAWAMKDRVRGTLVVRAVKFVLIRLLRCSVSQIRLGSPKCSV